MKQIIILDVAKDPAGVTNLRYVFWFPVPAGREVPTLNVSLFKGATAAENAAIQAGQVVEENYSLQFPAGTTGTQIKAALQNSYNNRQTQRNTVPPQNQMTGLYWDGTTWTQ